MSNISTLKSVGPNAYEEMGSNIVLPYAGLIPGGITDGMEIVISGTPQPSGPRFSINLCVGPNMKPDTALHFNPRFDCGTVVRNHMQGGTWGMEESSGLGPFQKGRNFDLMIKVTPTCYRVNVNSGFFCDFNHRIPKERVQYLFITGAVTINFIQCRSIGHGGARGGRHQKRGGFGHKHGFPGAVAAPPPYPADSMAPPPYAQAMPMSYPGGAPAPGPFYNPAVPFVSAIPGGLHPGRIIYISGIPHANPTRFTVNLACGGDSNADVGMTFDTRFNYTIDRNKTVRNHRVNGKWGPEERHQNYFPCAPNSKFEMMILTDPHCFKIAVNNQHFCEFTHRIQPMQRNTHLTITGDVYLTEVRFQ